MDNLRIDIGVKHITINDGPEFIEFNPSDIVFAEKFYQLIKDFEVKQVEYKKRSEEIAAKVEKDGIGIPTNLSDNLVLMRDVCEFMREKIDGLFGKDTSQKVFRDTLSLNMFEQFFTGITPFISTARTKKVAKYISHPKKKKTIVME